MEMMVQRKRLSCAETAKLVRRALKDAFPGVKFSVRSSTYSGGASIRVGWVDGPLRKDVQAVCNGFRAADFDGMQDMKVYRDSTLVANADGSYEEVSYGADYIFASRDVGEERAAAIEAELRRFVADAGGRVAEGGKIEMGDGRYVAVDSGMCDEPGGEFYVAEWWNDRCGTYVSELVNRAGLIRAA